MSKQFNIDAVMWAVRLQLNLARGRGKQTFQAKALLIELAGHADATGYGVVFVETFRERLIKTGGSRYSVAWLEKWLHRLEDAGHVSLLVCGGYLYFELVGYRPSGPILVTKDGRRVA